MKASISAFIATTLAAGAFAEMHNNAFCVDGPDGGVYVYNRAATEAACNNYRYRNTGGNWWDQCPDCTILNDQNIITYCNSAAQHMGGDELYYYCQLHGAADSMAW